MWYARGLVYLAVISVSLSCVSGIASLANAALKKNKGSTKTEFKNFCINFKEFCKFMYDAPASRSDEKTDIKSTDEVGEETQGEEGWKKYRDNSVEEILYNAHSTLHSGSPSRWRLTGQQKDNQKWKRESAFFRKYNNLYRILLQEQYKRILSSGDAEKLYRRQTVRSEDKNNNMNQVMAFLNRNRNYAIRKDKLVETTNTKRLNRARFSPEDYFISPKTNNYFVDQISNHLSPTLNKKRHYFQSNVNSRIKRILDNPDFYPNGNVNDVLGKKRLLSAIQQVIETSQSEKDSIKDDKMNDILRSTLP
eukprot:TCONS_00030208-protein